MYRACLCCVPLFCDNAVHFYGAKQYFEIESNESNRMIRVCHWRQTLRGIRAPQYSRVLYCIHLQGQYQESKQWKRAVLKNSKMSSKTRWMRSAMLSKVLIFAIRIGRNFDHYRVSENKSVIVCKSIYGYYSVFLVYMVGPSCTKSIMNSFDTLFKCCKTSILPSTRSAS